MCDPAQAEASSGGQVDTTASRPLESKREASSTSVNEASMMSYVEPSMLALAADEPEVKMKPAVSLGELRRFQTGGDYLLMALAALAAPLLQLQQRAAPLHPSPRPAPLAWRLCTW